MLCEAIEQGEIERVAELLQAGSSPNELDVHGNTPLIAAARRGDVDLVRLLLEAGADPDGRDFRDKTALMVAAEERRDKVLVALLEAGAEPDRHNARGRTALMYAAHRRQPKMVKALLDAGARADITDDRGWSALDFARADAPLLGNKCASLVTSAGAVQGRRRRSPIHRAWDADELELVRMFGRQIRASVILLACLFVLTLALSDPLGWFTALVVAPGWGLLLAWLFPSVVQLPRRLRASRSGADRPAPAGEEDLEELMRSVERRDLDHVSGFVRLGFRHLRARWEIALPLTPPIRRDHGISIALAGVSFLLPPALPVALALEYFLRRRRLRARQAQRDALASEIAASLEQSRLDEADRPDFVLYLRTFGVTGKLRVSHLDLETAIAYCIARFVPIVALGRPGEHLGAGRVPATDEAWQEEIVRLIEAASLILLIPSHHEGTLWEIALLKERGLFDKTVFVMPPQMPFDGGRFSEEWNSTAEALASHGLEIPLHYARGLFFTLDERGRLGDHARFDPERFLPQVAEDTRGDDDDSDDDGDGGDSSDHDSLDDAADSDRGDGDADGGDDGD